MKRLVVSLVLLPLCALGSDGCNSTETAAANTAFRGVSLPPM